MKKRDRVRRAAQTEARMQLIEVVREWGELRAVGVKELIFRMRTAPLSLVRGRDPEPTDGDAS